MLTLSIEEKDNSILYSVLTVSLIAGAIVFIATGMSYFIYRETIKKKFEEIQEIGLQSVLVDSQSAAALTRRQSASDYYTMMIALMGIFYTLPTFQLVMNYQKTYRETGASYVYFFKQRSSVNTQVYTSFCLAV